MEFEKFLIEPIHEKHAWRICDFVISNSDRLKRFFPKTLAHNLTPDLSKIFVEEKVKQFIAKKEFLFVLKDIESRTLIGLVYIKELDWQARKAELAYCIGYQYTGKGWMTKSVAALSKYAFEQLDLKSLILIIHKSNPGSIRVAEKCGYLWKHTLEKEHRPPNEAPLDMELYILQNPRDES